MVYVGVISDLRLMKLFFWGVYSYIRAGDCKCVRCEKWVTDKYTRFRCETLGRAKLVKRFRGCLGWYHAECAQVISTVTSHQDDSLRCTEQVVDDADICLPVKLHMIKFLNFFSFRIVATSFLGYLPKMDLSWCLHQQKRVSFPRESRAHSVFPGERARRTNRKQVHLGSSGWDPEPRRNYQPFDGNLPPYATVNRKQGYNPRDC